MRFMMIVKATKDSEAGVMPSQALVNAMMKYNEELVNAGVLVAGDGLHPSTEGIRISYPDSGKKPQVTDGPFTEAKELIAGFHIIEVKSKEEALEWALRMPDPHGYGEGEIELRQIFEAPELTQDQETLAKDAELREAVEGREKP
ncbi:YciI family protein [Gracilibacillus timonensis]|uniref:YciI family protein n=1 Tax=Gracilibacillus timonensis TaxID=1816696 RepID=UPI0008263B87|nr:YciI family protein [Gracilibacillus timonensis]